MKTVHDFKLLDHGFLKSVEVWGSDESIVEAARMSTQKGFLGWGPVDKCTNCGEEWSQASVAAVSPPPTSADFCGNCKYEGTIKRVPGDEKLLRYLYENKHATPFEMAGLTIEVQAPIFVFREWHRHRVPFGYNEMSARYAPLPDVNYVPSVERLMFGQSRTCAKCGAVSTWHFGDHLCNRGGQCEWKTNKQAGTVKDAEVLNENGALAFQVALREQYKTAQGIYEWALRAGVPKELARVHLPVGRYSRMRATGNLRGWLGFMTLRSAPTAQWEIRQYSDVIGKIIAAEFPRTWALFAEGRNR